MFRFYSNQKYLKIPVFPMFLVRNNKIKLTRLTSLYRLPCEAAVIERYVWKGNWLIPQQMKGFICNFACEITITYFLITLLIFTRLYLMNYAATATLSNYHLIDWWYSVISFCLLYDLIEFDFVPAYSKTSRKRITKFRDFPETSFKIHIA